MSIYPQRCMKPARSLLPTIPKETINLTLKLLVSTFLCLLSGSVSGQPYFNHYGVDEGVSNNAILCSVQDKDGFLWFGTKDGLNRFDGYTFKQYYSDTDSNNGLGSNFIHSLLVDREKNIWAGTDQGIYIFNPFLERFTPFSHEKEAEILQIEEDGDGNIWFISNNRLFCFLPKTKELVQRSSIHEHVVSAFGFDQAGRVWMGSGDFITCLNTNVSYRLPKLNTAPQWIEKIYTDSQGLLWIGTSKHGVYTLEPKTGQIKQVLPSIGNNPLFVRDIYQPDPNHLWIGTESGVVIYNRHNGKYQVLRHQGDDPWSLSDNAVYTICGDHQGGLWVGTFFGGVNYHHPQHDLFQKFFPRFSRSSIQGHAVREIVEDSYQQLWVGTEDNGLCVWNRSNGIFSTLTLLSGLSHTNIHGLALVGDSLLVGTFDRGLDIVDVRTRKIIRHLNTDNTHGGLSNNFVFHIYRTRQGRVLLATARGLCEFFPGTDRVVLLKEAPDYIFYTSIFEDKDGVLWLATWRDGLYRIDPKDGRIQIFRHDRNNPKSLNSNRVNRVYQDSNNFIWIATENGLAQWSADGTPVRRITKKDGLPSNLILAMEEDNEGNLWISTTRGLVRLRLQDQQIRIFDKESGLLDLQFNYNSVHKDSKGHFYFGSSTGLIRFHPDSIRSLSSPQPPVPIYITRIQILQRDLRVGHGSLAADTAVTYIKKIKLKHDESTISLDFAALNFVTSKSTSYMYLLEGFDKEWTLLRQSHTAHFTKLPPGSYRFRVKAVDVSGQAISNELSLDIEVDPPIWASTAAFILYFIAASILIYLLVTTYDRRIKEKNRRRLEAIKTHRERELFRVKMDFLARVAHDIKTPLTLIKAPLERLRHQPQSDPRTVRLLDTMHNNTEKLVGLTNQLLDFRKIESSEHNLKLERLSVNQLVSDRLLEFQPAFNQRHLSFSYRCDRVIDAYIDAEIVCKIIDNLLTNAVKYADKIVAVELKVDSNGRFFSFVVKNDGRQLSEQDINAVFKPFYRTSRHLQIEGSGLGLALAHSFAELHRGSLIFLNNSENLNIFVLQIPIEGTYD